MKITEIFDAIKMFYDSIDVWTIAIKQDDTWVNYYTKIMPTSEPFSEIRRIIETDRIMVLHESHKVEDFSSILESLKSDAMNVCNVKIHLSTASNFRLDREMDFSYYGWILDQFRTEYPLYRYEVRPSSTPNFPRNLNGVLWSLTRPYKDMDDIMREVLTIKSSDYNWGSVYIILPVFLSLKCSFEQNVLHFIVKFHNKMMNQIVMGFILRDSNGGAKRYSKPVNKDKITFSGDFCCYEGSENVEANIISADIFIHHKKIPFIAQTKEAVRYGLSPSIELLKNFWSEDYFISCLNGENGDKAFEWSLATLLTFCGFKVLWVGWGKGRVELGGADILALYEDTITVAECTTGSIKPEKIDKLLKATRIVEETLGLEEKSAEKVFPVLFTCSDVSSATIKSSQDSGVRIIGPREIEQIYEAVKRNKPIREKVRLVAGKYYL